MSHFWYFYLNRLASFRASNLFTAVWWIGTFRFDLEKWRLFGNAATKSGISGRSKKNSQMDCLVRKQASPIRQSAQMSQWAQTRTVCQVHQPGGHQGGWVRKPLPYFFFLLFPPVANLHKEHNLFKPGCSFTPKPMTSRLHRGHCWWDHCAVCV